MAWLLCDYGNVISLPQPREVQATLAGLCGMTPEDFHDAYWRERLAYDRGDTDVSAYFQAVAGRPLEPALIDQLSAIDVEGWCRANEHVLGAIEEARGRRGYDLALLSNAPVEIARALDREPWMARFAPRLFSCDLHATKPDAACFKAALDALSADPDEVIFIDDSAANIEGAVAVGIRALHYAGPETFAQL
ncbi:MAG: HAD family phosphatase [Actinomycetota bacterium]|nr:HAD family phosphatase [Actinomycetota bacterium]